MRPDWKSFASCPPDRSVLLYQPATDTDDELIIVGSIERLRGGKVWIWPEGVQGYEWECDLVRPTHWASRPEAPQAEDKSDAAG